MGYLQHKTVHDSLSHVKEQYNIMALVGNGFDVQVLSEYDQSPTTQYVDFYRHLKQRGISDQNLILQKMQSLKAAGDENWSDVERGIADLEAEGADGEEIQSSLIVIQKEFSDFLNRIVGSDLLSRLSDDAQSNEWSKATHSRFLSDLLEYEDLQKIPFGAKKGFYDLYNYYFVNFNYTSVLDNYLYLDSEQFEPTPHRTVGTNFTFDTNPGKLGPSTKWNFSSSSNLMSQIIHPHGYQDIPRSLLFGTGYSDDPRDRRSRLAKPYWAQNQLKYGHLFEDTHLFIVFGCSLGQTDAWWWSSIAQALLSDSNRALILYWWNSPGKALKAASGVRNDFYDASGVAGGDRVALDKQICVVSYNDASDRVWLSTKRSSKTTA